MALSLEPAKPHAGALMADETDSLHRPETFTKAPLVPFDPDARPHLPVRAAMPGEEPPQGLRVDDLGPAGESEPNIRLALLAEPFDVPGNGRMTVATAYATLVSTRSQPAAATSWCAAMSSARASGPSARLSPPTARSPSQNVTVHDTMIRERSSAATPHRV